jgi:hypothetical protein
LNTGQTDFYIGKIKSDNIVDNTVDDIVNMVPKLEYNGLYYCFDRPIYLLNDFTKNLKILESLSDDDLNNIYNHKNEHKSVNAICSLVHYNHGNGNSNGNSNSNSNKERICDGVSYHDEKTLTGANTEVYDGYIIKKLEKENDGYYNIEISGITINECSSITLSVGGVDICKAEWNGDDKFVFTDFDELTILMAPVHFYMSIKIADYVGKDIGNIKIVYSGIIFETNIRNKLLLYCTAYQLKTKNSIAIFYNYSGGVYVVDDSDCLVNGEPIVRYTEQNDTLDNVTDDIIYITI